MYASDTSAYVVKRRLTYAHDRAGCYQLDAIMKSAPRRRDQGARSSGRAGLARQPSQEIRSDDESGEGEDDEGGG